MVGAVVAFDEAFRFLMMNNDKNQIGFGSREFSHPLVVGLSLELHIKTFSESLAARTERHSGIGKRLFFENDADSNRPVRAAFGDWIRQRHNFQGKTKWHIAFGERSFRSCCVRSIDKVNLGTLDGSDLSVQHSSACATTYRPGFVAL